MNIQTREIALSRKYVASVFRNEYSRSKLLWLFTVASLLVVFALTSYGYHLRGDFVVLEAWIPYLALVALWWLFVVGWVPWSMARSPMMARLRVPGRFTFTQDAVEQELTDGTTKRVPYSSLVRVKLRARYALLDDADGSSIIVPYSAFMRNDDLARIVALLTPDAALARTSGGDA